MRIENYPAITVIVSNVVRREMSVKSVREYRSHLAWNNSEMTSMLQGRVKVKPCGQAFTLQDCRKYPFVAPTENLVPS